MDESSWIAIRDLFRLHPSRWIVWVLDWSKGEIDRFNAAPASSDFFLAVEYHSELRVASSCTDSN